MEVQRDLTVRILRWLAALESPAQWDERELQVLPGRQDVPFALRERSDRGEGGASGLLPPKVADDVVALQRAMFAPGKGTWFTASLVVTAAGSGDARFSYDDQPLDAEGRPAVGAEDVRDHLQRFPRDPDTIPAWMAAAARAAS